MSVRLKRGFPLILNSGKGWHTNALFRVTACMAMFHFQQSSQIIDGQNLVLQVHLPFSSFLR
jgi:hypothetical protein